MDPQPNVTLTGCIPGPVARWQAIEGAIREAFRGLRGAWRVDVVPARHSSWWLIRLDDGNGFRRALLAGRRTHDPEQIYNLVRASLRTANRPALRRPAA